jgi:hypothetical protein
MSPATGTPRGRTLVIAQPLRLGGSALSGLRKPMATPNRAENFSFFVTKSEHAVPRAALTFRLS